MAIITPFIATNAFVGQPLKVKARKVIWVPVGQGELAAVSEEEVAVAGQISILGYSGVLNIRLQLADNDPYMQEGLCLLQLNSYIDDHATYLVKGPELVVQAVLSGKKQNIAVSPCNNGTQTSCRLYGHINQTVHLDPS